jgi:hypothetical protein
MGERVTGKFINISHDAASLDGSSESTGRMRVTARRQYAGEIAGNSVGDLLACQTGEMRFGYVGMDHFSGSLHGRSGTFVFQHGEMNDRGAIRAFGFIVSGSGTGDLQGIAGAVRIVVSGENEHTITFDYTL